MKYGWMWMIPLQNRIGCGYNFDSSLTNVEEAKKEVEDFFNNKIEFRKEIDYNAGRFEKVWVENCIAVGLSSSFTEPIEATSIFNSINQLSLISEKILLKYFEGNTKVIKDYKKETVEHITENINYLKNKGLLFDDYTKSPIGPFAIINLGYEQLLRNRISSVPLNNFALVKDRVYDNCSRISVAVNHKLFKEYFDKMLINEKTTI